MATIRLVSTESVLIHNWWAIALRGVLGIIFGLIAFLVPGATMLSLVIVFSAYMLVDGALAILAAVRAAQRHSRWGLFTLEGIVDIAAGVLAIVWPGPTVLAFVLLVAVWALASGGVMFAGAFQVHATHGRWWLALGGLASIIYGALLIMAPFLGAIILAWWLGAYAFIFGTLLLMFSFKLRSLHNAPAHATASART
jgi:uncharacterized membrane protein HdeD (DUF308 family)